VFECDEDCKESDKLTIIKIMFAAFIF